MPKGRGDGKNKKQKPFSILQPPSPRPKEPWSPTDPAAPCSSSRPLLLSTRIPILSGPQRAHLNACHLRLSSPGAALNKVLADGVWVGLRTKSSFQSTRANQEDRVHLAKRQNLERTNVFVLYAFMFFLCLWCLRVGGHCDPQNKATWRRPRTAREDALPGPRCQPWRASSWSTLVEQKYPPRSLSRGLQLWPTGHTWRLLVSRFMGPGPCLLT